MPGVAEFLGPDGVVFGYLTSTSLMGRGEPYRTPPVESLHAETELAVTLGQDISPTADVAACHDALAGFAVAVEIVDVAQPPVGGMHEIIAENVYHRAVAFGPTRPIAALPAHATGEIAVDDSTRETGLLREDPADSVLAIARLLAAVGERLRAGDRIITGSITHVPVQPGDEVRGEIQGLGTAELSVAAPAN